MAENKTRTVFIEVAGRTFERFGFKKTTMDDIAYATGKGKSSLYYYFKNKEEVFEAVVNHEAEQLKNEIFEVLAKETDPVEQLRKYILIRMRRFVKRGNLYKALTDNFLTTYNFIEKIRNHYREWELDTLAAILTKGKSTGAFKALDVNFTSHALLTAMIGFELPLLQTTESEIEYDQKIRDVINMLFYGICT